MVVRDFLGATIRKSEELSDLLGCSVDVLDYSGTASGTHKTFLAVNVLAAVRSALRDPSRTVYAVLTAGNYGLALKQNLKPGERLVIVMDEPSEAVRGQLTDEQTAVVPMQELFPQRELYFGLPRVHPQQLDEITFSGRLRAFYERSGRDFVRPEDYLLDVTNIFTGLTSEDSVLNGGQTYRIESDLEDGCFYSFNLTLQELDYPRHRLTHVFTPAGTGFYALQTALALGIPTVKVYGISQEWHPLVTEKPNFDMPNSEWKALAEPLDHGVKYWSQLLNRDAISLLSFLGAKQEEEAPAYSLARELGWTTSPSGSAALVIADQDFQLRHGLSFHPVDRVLIVNTGLNKLYQK